MGAVKRFADLKEEVIDSELCVYCGACAAFCSKIKLGSLPVLAEECVSECSAERGKNAACYASCPALFKLDAKHVFGGAKRDEALGHFIEVKGAKSRKELRNAQDGGAVTSLLASALKNKKIDAAIIVCRDEKWNPYPKLITSLEELREGCGSKYTRSPNAFLLGEAFRNLKLRSIAVVGLPCHIQAVRNFEHGLLYNAGFSAASDLKIYALGLFCSGTFDYEKLIPRIGMDVAEIKRMEVKGTELIVHGSTTARFPLSNLRSAIVKGCHTCRDYTAELADISIGSIGSPEGWSTVILRSKKGWELLRDAEQEFIEVSDNVNVESLKKAALKRKKKSKEQANQRGAAGCRS